MKMLPHVDISDNSQRHERRQPALLLLLLSASVFLAFHPGMDLLLFDPSVTRYVCCHVLRRYGAVQRWWGGIMVAMGTSEDERTAKD